MIPNKLSNGKTCQGLLRRFVYKITNNDEISPHNDMKDKILNPSWIIGGSVGSTQPSPRRASLLPKSEVQDDKTFVVQNIAKDKNVKNSVP